ncbi:hypothetical protein M422DRAFT_272203 [Sphaerobolus stellatus SS14]|uniref:Uncharacterized protein n=1 Tax=Sphaerobolus stellatus (strain SS14) TaxID=990650 RepID=A0A0C9TC05_SPHS4|nr:hypothetical protein M422DRAFT_272203 [Sphaerobolus stellatus SS14]
MKWIDVIEALGVDGMSSDESDTGTSPTHPTFKQKHNPSRAPAVDKFVFVLDSFQNLPNVLGQLPRRGGNHPRTRPGTHPILVNTKPILDLPEMFYNMKYLAKFPGTLEIFRALDTWSKNITIPTVFNGKAAEIAAKFQPHKYPGWEEYAC